MKKLKTALIGLGRIGWEYHMPKIVQNVGFELVCVVDPLPDRLLEASKRYKVKGYLNHLDMFKEQNLDLVVIASPTPFHAEQTIASFKAGSDVFCEKPAAKNFKEFEDMFGVSKSLNKKFMIYQPYRISKETRALKEILSQGKIGPVYMIRRNWFEYSRRSDWQSLKKFGGGMLSNYGSHFLDQLFYLTEYKSRSVNCIHRNLISPGDAEDFVKVLIETENRTILDIEVNLASAHQLPSWQILGKYGSIVLEDETQSWKLKYCNPKEMIGIRVSTDLAAKDRKYRNGENIEWVEEIFPFDDLPEVDYYDKCYDYFALNKPPLVPIWQTRELMRVLDCCSKIGNHLNLPIKCSPSHISSKIIEQKRVY